MSAADSSEDETLRACLERGEPRFFRVGSGSVRGWSGAKDTQRFAEELVVLNESALLLGERLGMEAVSFGACYEGEETLGFCFDPNSSSRDPEIAGGIVNRRMPIRSFVEAVRNSMDG